MEELTSIIKKLVILFSCAIPINDHRKRFAKFDGCTLNSIPDKLTAVTYCDGDFSQINAIKSSIDFFTNNKVIANKQHTSWSGVKQPADLARVFKLIKNMLPLHTVKIIPAERCPMKALMLDSFKEKLEHLNLAPNKRHSLVDLISSLSNMATKVCTVKNIQHRFIEAGMIDAENFVWTQTEEGESAGTDRQKFK